jgi:hypothetical protein
LERDRVRGEELDQGPKRCVTDTWMTLPAVNAVVVLTTVFKVEAAKLKMDLAATPAASILAYRWGGKREIQEGSER